MIRTPPRDPLHWPAGAEQNKSPMVIMACDHPIHWDCLQKHTLAYMERVNVMRVVDPPDDVDDDALNSTTITELKYVDQGAPCPMCRLPFPMRHMSVFYDE